MNGIQVLLWVGLGVVAYLIIAFNRTVGRRNAVAHAFSSLDALLEKRYDLIPNLIAAVNLNNAIEMFPSNVVGALFGFRRAPLFEAAGEERAAVSAALSGPAPG